MKIREAGKQRMLCVTEALFNKARLGHEYTMGYRQL